MNVATDFVAPVLDIQNVSFTYPDGTPALRDVNLTVQPGSRVAVIGQNGSGKSTLARQMNGLLRPTTGSVRLDGVDIGSHHVAELARTVGLAFQNPDRQIFAGRVATEVGFGPRNLGLRGADLDATVNRALALVGLTAAGDTNPYDLGFARRKLLSLASVIAMDPAIAVLDEPTTGQDVEGVGRVRSVMDDLSSRGRTMIGISHDMRFVAEAFERVIVMRDGRIVLDGTPADVFAEAAWPVLASTFLEPPLAARIGARLGLGSTPTDETLLAALAR